MLQEEKVVSSLCAEIVILNTYVVLVLKALLL